MTGRTVIGRIHHRHIILLDSISFIGPDDAGQIVVSGSHGGTVAAAYARRHPPWLVVFNDAGVGKDAAGSGPHVEPDWGFGRYLAARHHQPRQRPRPAAGRPPRRSAATVHSVSAD